MGARASPSTDLDSAVCVRCDACGCAETTATADVGTSPRECQGGERRTVGRRAGEPQVSTSQRRNRCSVQSDTVGVRVETKSLGTESADEDDPGVLGCGDRAVAGRAEGDHRSGPDRRGLQDEIGADATREDHVRTGRKRAGQCSVTDRLVEGVVAADIFAYSDRRPLSCKNRRVRGTCQGKQAVCLAHELVEREKVVDVDRFPVRRRGDLVQAPFQIVGTAPAARARPYARLRWDGNRVAEDDRRLTVGGFARTRWRTERHSDDVAWRDGEFGHDETHGERGVLTWRSQCRGHKLGRCVRAFDEDRKWLLRDHPLGAEPNATCPIDKCHASSWRRALD